MKEELQSKLVEILTSIQTAAGKASDFALAELPDIAQSYVVFGRAWLTLAVVLAVVWVVAVPLGARIIHKRTGEDIVWLSASISLVVPLIILLESLKPMVMVWFAPKVWLLKEIAGLLK
jgi:hypothetical protein